MQIIIQVVEFPKCLQAVVQVQQKWDMEIFHGKFNFHLLGSIYVTFEYFYRMAAIILNEKQSNECGGVLISDSKVLTGNN